MVDVFGIFRFVIFPTVLPAHRAKTSAKAVSSVISGFQSGPGHVFRIPPGPANDCFRLKSYPQTNRDKEGTP